MPTPKNRMFSTVTLLAVSLVLGCGKSNDNGGGGQAATELKPTYASIQANILGTKCLSCHTGPKTSAKKPNLANYQALVQGPSDEPLLVPGNPDRSLLYTVLVSGKMPLRAPHLSDTEIKAVHDWIANGAKEAE